MKKIIVDCPNCNAEVEVEDKYKKAMCDNCGSSFLIEEAIKNKKESNKEEKEKLNKLDKDELLKELDDLIIEEKYTECINKIKKVDDSNIFLTDKLLTCKLNIFKRQDISKLNNTDDVMEMEFWNEVRELLKLYNEDSKINSGLLVEDIKYINMLSDSYKKMLIDKEQCERIDILIKKYFSYLNNVPKNLQRKANNKSSEFFKKLLGINMIKYYKINRNMTINYKHAKDNKHVYSRLSNFNNLDDVYKVLVDNFDDYKKLLSEDNNKMTVYIIIGILVVIALALIIIL